MFDRASGAETGLGCRRGYHVTEQLCTLGHRPGNRIARREPALLCMECVVTVPVVLLSSNAVIVMKSTDSGLTMAQSVVQYENEIDSVKT